MLIINQIIIKMRITSSMLVILFLIALHLHPVAGQAQQSGGSLEVTGRVMDADGTLLQGVTVEEIGVKNGTMTDANGTYTITMSKEQATLRFRLIGRSEEHTSELQSRENLVCRLLLEKKKKLNPTET